MPRRVVITSIGVVSSLGGGPDEILNSIKADRTCFERLNLKQHDFEDIPVICPVKGFNLKSFTGRFKNARYLNRGAGFCVAAAMTAIKKIQPEKGRIERRRAFCGNRSES